VDEQNDLKLKNCFGVASTEKALFAFSIGMSVGFLRVL
jgi:hypothetical protein